MTEIYSESEKKSSRVKIRPVRTVSSRGILYKSASFNVKKTSKSVKKETK